MAITLLQRGLIRSFGSALTSLFRGSRNAVRVYADGGKHMKVDEHGVIHIHGPAPSDITSLKGIDAVLGVMTHECAHGWAGNYPWFKWFMEEKSHHPKDCPKELIHAVANVALDINDENEFASVHGGFQHYLGKCLTAGIDIFETFDDAHIATLRKEAPWKIPLCLYYFIARGKSAPTLQLRIKYPREFEIAELLYSFHVSVVTSVGVQLSPVYVDCMKEMIGNPPATMLPPPTRRCRMFQHKATEGSEPAYTFRVPYQPFFDMTVKNGLPISGWDRHACAVLILHLLRALLEVSGSGGTGKCEGGEKGDEETKGESDGPTPEENGDPQDGDDGSSNEQEGKEGEGSNGTSDTDSGDSDGLPTESKGGGEQRRGGLSGGAAYEPPTTPQNYDLDGGSDPISSLHEKIMGESTDEANENEDFGIPDHLAIALLGLDVDKRELARVRRISRQHARSLLVAPRSMACQPSPRGVRLGNVTRLPVDGRVFNKRASRLATNTAVAILLDASYSIGSQMRKLSGACQGMAEGLRECSHVTMKCWSFSDKITPLTVAQIGRIKLQGSTRTLCALRKADEWLTRQLEPRKIILIFTDGSPNLNSLLNVERLCHDLHRRHIVLVGGAINGYDVHSLVDTMPHAITFSIEQSDYSHGFRKAAEQVRRITTH